MSSTSFDVNEGDIITFELVEGNILFDKRTEVKVCSSEMTFEVARLIDPELAKKHTAFFPYISDVISNNDSPAAYNYFAIKNDNGTVEVIGKPWVNPSSLNQISSKKVIYVVDNFQEKWRAPLNTFLSNLGASYTSTTSED